MKGFAIFFESDPLIFHITMALILLSTKYVFFSWRAQALDNFISLYTYRV